MGQDTVGSDRILRNSGMWRLSGLHSVAGTGQKNTGHGRVSELPAFYLLLEISSSFTVAVRSSAHPIAALCLSP
jgi:hypothetical protein